MRSFVIEESDPRSHFSLALVLFDAVPVVLFCVNCLLASSAMGSPVFAVGSVVCALSGLAKVVWKLVVVTRKLDYPVLAKQMRVVMPIGFALLAAGILCSDHAAATTLLHALSQPPAALLVMAWAAALGAMGTYAAKLDGTQSRNNWLEEGTNTFGQLCMLAALLFA